MHNFHAQPPYLQMHHMHTLCLNGINQPKTRNHYPRPQWTFPIIFETLLQALTNIHTHNKRFKWLSSWNRHRSAANKQTLSFNQLQICFVLMKLNFSRNLQGYHMNQVVLWLRKNPVIYMKRNEIDNILTHYINIANERDYVHILADILYIRVPTSLARTRCRLLWGTSGRWGSICSKSW